MWIKIWQLECQNEANTKHVEKLVSFQLWFMKPMPSCYPSLYIFFSEVNSFGYKDDSFFNIYVQ
jgi:hypothetical protein